MLEECMSKCGPKFHSEVGKFRFLNELIRLVSPQYDGDKTPKKICDKILDLLLLWTINFPHEKKIKDAYEMLLKRGVRHETAKPVVQENNKCDVKQRESAQPDLSAKLQRLLRSSNPVDYKAANLLIQNMVKEKERRHEVKMRRKLELKEITENANVLKQMLDQIECEQNNGSTEDIAEDVLATLNFLFESCQKLQPTILILIGDTGDDNDCLGNSVWYFKFIFHPLVLKHKFIIADDALETNDLVAKVFKKYRQLIITNRSKYASPCLISTPSTSSVVSNHNGTNKSTMDELHEIFASSNSTKPIMTPTPLKPAPATEKVTTNGIWQMIFIYFKNVSF